MFNLILNSYYLTKITLVLFIFYFTPQIKTAHRLSLGYFFIQHFHFYSLMNKLTDEPKRVLS